MSEDWQVKEVKKSGDGFWINVQPSQQYSGAEGPAHLFNVIVLSMSFMHIFGVTGFGWWVFWAVISFIISLVLYIPSLVMSFIILGVFLFT